MIYPAKIVYNKYVFNQPPGLKEKDFNYLKAEVSKNENFTFDNYYSKGGDDYWMNLVWKIILIIILFTVSIFFNSSIVGLCGVVLIFSCVFETFSFINYKSKKRNYFFFLKERIAKAASYHDFVIGDTSGFKDLSLIEKKYRAISDNQIINLINNSKSIPANEKDILDKIYLERKLELKNKQPTFGGLTVKQMKALFEEDYNKHISTLSKNEYDLYLLEILKD